MQAFFMNVTNRFLFQKKLDYGLLIESLTGRLSGIRDPHELSREIVNFVTTQMALEWTALYLGEGDDEKMAFISFEGTGPAPGPEAQILVKEILTGKRGAFFLSPFDVEEDLRPEVKAKLRSEKIEAALPLFLEERLCGMLLLGKKKSDDTFTPHDEALLKTLMEEVSMLFLSARLLKEAARSHLELGQRMKMSALMKLSGGVYHEVKNPLHAITLLASSSLLDAQKGEFRRLSLGEIQREIRETTALITEDVGRIQNSLGRFAEFGKTAKRTRLAGILLKAEVEKFLALMKEGRMLHSIRVHDSVPQDLAVLASEEALREIFFNLFNNAYESMQGRGELFLEAREKGNFVEIKFRDTGPGIASEILPNIFEAYFTTRKDTEAVGIGLTLTRQRVEEMGGSIEARSSEAGRGAEFIVRLKAPLEGLS
jgi:signal transduction histidine kinase